MSSKRRKKYSKYSLTKKNRARFSHAVPFFFSMKPLRTCLVHPREVRMEIEQERAMAERGMRRACARILRRVRGKLFLMRPIREVHVTNMIFVEDK